MEKRLEESVFRIAEAISIVAKELRESRQINESLLREIVRLADTLASMDLPRRGEK